ncbi:hypothetical protein LT679_15900 [Mucilaginibacter roseus]|uniref:Uncharacterized protein n=1 Tax=Mucilaginibacter roseus TaxID=1528868 RepID=A0ABS8U7I1_9SPHI|nr:hypothetical protein [Mucilaginibacter roseus]MCD8742095.1 hypothetical protein [Mucilaginibacter roseus]
MKKIIYALVLPLVVVSGLVFANDEVKDEPLKKTTSKPLTATEKEAALKRWEATPDGIKYKEWKASAEGRKVFDASEKVRADIKDYSDMDAVITSLSLPPNSSLGFGLMVKINNEDYILSFGTEKTFVNFLTFNGEFKQLYNLKINDRIIIRSHSVSHAPKYSYPIISGDYVKYDGKVIYERAPRKGGC